MTGTVAVFAAALVVVFGGAALRPRVQRPLPSRHRSRAGQRPLLEPRVVGRVIGIVTRVAHRRTRRSPIAADALAQWCDELSRRVRAGASLNEALGTTGSTDTVLDEALDRVRHAIARGAPAATAVRLVGGTDPDVRLVVSVLSAGARLGGSPAAAIDRTAAALRQRSTDRAERLVQSAQARLSAQVLTVLPIALLGVLAIADGDVRAAVAEPIGTASVTLGLVANTLGWWWMRRVIGP